MFILNAGYPTNEDILKPLRNGSLSDECTVKLPYTRSSASSPKTYSFHKEFQSLPREAQLNFAKLLLSSALKGSGLTAEEILDDPSIIEKELSLNKNNATATLEECYEKTRLVLVDKKVSGLQSYKAVLNEFYNMDQAEHIPLTLPQVEMKIKMFEALQNAGVQEIKLPEKAVNQELSAISRAIRSWEKQNESEAKIIADMKRVLLDN